MYSMLILLILVIVAGWLDSRLDWEEDKKGKISCLLVTLVWRRASKKLRRVLTASLVTGALLLTLFVVNVMGL